MKTILVAAFVLASQAPAGPSFAPPRAPSPAPHPEQFSFVDVFHLTVAGAPPGLAAAESAPDAPIRVTAAPAVAEPRFTISTVPQPEKWLLLLSGLALAGWVAHRRLARSF